MLIVLALPVLLTALAGCNPRNQSQAEYTPSADRLQTSRNDSLGLPGAILSPERTRAVPAPHGPISITLSAVPPRAVTGTAELKSFGALTAAHLTVSNGKHGVHYAGSIRRGRCDGAQHFTAGLPTVSADATGRGSASSDADVPLQDLVDGAHVVVLSSNEEPHACGAIPSRLPPSPQPPGMPAPDTLGAGPPASGLPVRTMPATPPDTSAGTRSR